MNQPPLSINEFCGYVTRWRNGMGFYTPSGLTYVEQRDMMLGKLMLVSTEIAEAAEAVRHQDLPNFTEELADTIIRIFDIAGTMNLNLEEAVKAKMLVNEKRPFLHDKKCSL